MGTNQTTEFLKGPNRLFSRRSAGMARERMSTCSAVFLSGAEAKEEHAVRQGPQVSGLGCSEKTDRVQC